MLSIFLILSLIIVFFVAMQKTKKPFLQAAVLMLFVLLIVECCVYGFFLYKIKKGDCFFLIGNQLVLDKLIKSKIIKATSTEKTKHNSFYIIDPDLGYTVAKNTRYQKYKTNKYGIRSNREYLITPPDDKLRIALFGDSYVFCDWERNHNTWPHILENSVGGLEILNFGVSGYGLSQSYSRYLKDGVQFKPDVIFFNYLLMGNRDRLDLNTIIGKGKLGLSSLYRIYFSISDGKLESKVVTPLDFFDADFRRKYIYKPLMLDKKYKLLENKAITSLNLGLFVKQYVLHRAVVNSPIDLDVHDPEVNAKIIENLLETAAVNKTTVFFFFPDDVKNLPKEIGNLFWKYKDIVVYMNSGKILSTRFKSHGYKMEELYNATSHFNPEGNLYYAEAFAGILKGRNWGKGERVFYYDSKKDSLIKR